jgi:hypothetical protein
MKEKKKKKKREKEREGETTTNKKKRKNIDDDDDCEKKKKKKKEKKKEKEDDGSKRTTTLPKKLNDIDAEIERLSRLVAEAAPEESGDDDDEEEDDLGGNSSSSSSLGRIAPLPPEAYPEHYGYGSKRGNEGAFKGKRVSSSSISAASKNVLIPGLAEREKNRPKCETCNLSFTSQAQLEEHLKGKGHRRKAAGGATQRQQQQHQHQHQRREVKPPEGPHCKLCRKMFTSLAQKEEHEGGKWHKMRVEGKLAPSNKPYA